MFPSNDPDGILYAIDLPVIGGDEKGVIFSRPAVSPELGFRIRPLPPNLPHLRVGPDAAFLECVDDILVSGITVDDEKHLHGPLLHSMLR